MKQVKILVSLGIIDPDDSTKSYSPAPGAVAELPDAIADELLAIGYAEAVEIAEPEADAPAPKGKRKS
jgi:hypothetical protein